MSTPQPAPPPFPATFPTRLVGKRLLYFPTLPSTMDLARQEAGRGAEEGTVVVAGEQTAGRGRHGRSWLSPEGGLPLSVILRPPLALLPGLAMIAPLAVARTISQLYGLEAAIKWPNDVLLRGKKVAGILIESGVKGRGVSYAIVGIGLNVGFDPQAFPELAAIATSLSAELGRRVSPWEVLPGLLAELDRLYQALKAGQPVQRWWKEKLETLGQRVRVAGPGGVEEGVALDVDLEGNLILERPDGSRVSLSAGEVTRSHPEIIA